MRSLAANDTVSLSLFDFFSLDIYARLHYRGDEANTLVHHAMRLWGRINTWNETQLHSLGPLWTLLSPRDLRRINPDYVSKLFHQSVDFG